MKASEILKAAKKRLSARGAWTQNGFARNKAGWKVEPENPDAVSFCAAGACYLSSCGIDTIELDDALHWLNEAAFSATKGRMDAIAYNDRPERTKSQMLVLFDKAIKLARKDECK